MMIVFNLRILFLIVLMLIAFSPVIPQVKNETGEEGRVTGSKFLNRYREVKTIYENPLSAEADVRKFILEGEAGIGFPNNRLRMQNTIDPSQKQKANFVYWCPVEFPDRISITWDFYPIEEPGLCILFFSAKGINTKDIFDKSVNQRTGEYAQYHHGDINAYHISYFRRNINERDFQLCNLRKSYGFYMVAQGADPIPAVQFAKGPYKMRVVMYEGTIEFYINELPVLQWTDDGRTYGGILNGGKIGFRQMAPLVAEYANLKVIQIEKNN